MSPRIVKYNPAFLTDDELIRNFVVRQSDLELLLRILRENTGRANQHVLLIGSRGIGKTTLALRLATEVRQAADLKDHWYPIVFGEESYEVSSMGRFWLEALLHLGEQTQDDRWKKAYLELRSEREDHLAQRALGQLMDYADACHCRLLLVVENLHMLLGDQVSDKDAWALREVLLNEPRIMLLGSATSHFKEITQYNSALYEVFRILEIKPLDTQECANLWRGITGQDIDVQHIRPLEILTGGNPRLLTIMASVEKAFSLRNLVDDLKQLIDDHTDYFKSILDSIPPTERRVYLALAEIWAPATAKDVAIQTGLAVNIASSLLKRLVERGAVVVSQVGKQKHEYQIAERLYNIYYLMRRHGGPSSRVQAVVKFMSSFYAPDELVEKTRCIAEEACSLGPNDRQEHFPVYRDLYNLLKTPDLREVLLKTTPSKFFEMNDAPADLKEIYTTSILKPKQNIFETKTEVENATVVDYSISQKEKEVEESWIVLFNKAKSLLALPEHQEEAEKILSDALTAVPNNPQAKLNLGFKLQEELHRYEAAESIYREAIELKPNFEDAWVLLGGLFHLYFQNYKEAEKCYRRAIELKPDYLKAWVDLGQLLHENLKNYSEAEKCYRKVIELKPDTVWAWTGLGSLLQFHLNNFSEAEKCYRRAIELKPDYEYSWILLGHILHENPKNYMEAEKCYRRAIELKPDCAEVWVLLGQILEFANKDLEAEKCYRKAIELEPNQVMWWMQLGRLLCNNLFMYSEAEKCYRKAIELEPDYVWAWAHLGCLFYENLKIYSDAEKCFRKALELKPDYAWVWGQLGQLLHEKLNDFSEAEKCFRRAIELTPDYASCYGELFTLLWEQPERRSDASEYFDTTLRTHREEAEFLNGFAWSLFEKDNKDLLPKAEQAAMRAVELAPTQGYYLHTLASILSAQGKTGLALHAARKYLADLASVQSTISDAIDLFIDLASSGQAREALRILRDSPSAHLLEPLIAGIRIFLHEEVKVATEIFEVGKDVAKRIEDRQAARRVIK